MYLTKVSGRIGHKQVMSGFPSMESLTPRLDLGVLFREGSSSTLIQSIVPFVHDTFEYEQKKFELGLTQDKNYYFETVINAVSRKEGRDQNIDPIEWFNKRDFGGTFTIESAVHIPGTFESKGRKVVLNRYLVNGTVFVKDADRLSQAVSSGIGRGKAWGCGLISMLET